MEVLNVESRVQRLLMERIGLGAAKVDSRARLREDLGMDSLDGVQLVIAAEKEFDVAITDEQVDALKTVGDLISLIERLSASSGEHR